MNLPNQEKSSRSIIIAILVCMALCSIGILLISAPAAHLLGDSAYAVRSAFHGLVAGIFMITITLGLYPAFRLWGGMSVNIRELEIGSMINAVACFLTIVTGNWIYIAYRTPGGPRTQFLESVPEIHKIFFEFKEFGALFTLPLVVAASYLIFRYAERINENKQVKDMIALLLVLAFFYFVIAFGLGAAITKLKSV